MSTLKVDKLDPSSGTALEIGSSGDTMTVPSGATFTVAGTLGATSGANLTNLPAANVTGVLPVGVTGGSGLSVLNATNLTSGTVSTSRFPSGTIVKVTAIENGTRTTVTHNTMYTWGTFVKAYSSTTKIAYAGTIHGGTQVDCDGSGMSISFESTSLSQTHFRHLANHDEGNAGGAGSIFASVHGTNTSCVYAETYTVKWGTTTGSSMTFSKWNPNTTDDARYDGQRVSVLLVYEIVI